MNFQIFPLPARGGLCSRFLLQVGERRYVIYCAKASAIEEHFEAGAEFFWAPNLFVTMDGFGVEALVEWARVGYEHFLIPASMSAPNCAPVYEGTSARRPDLVQPL